MAIISEYYAVSINVFPFKFGEEKEIGCYSTRDTADRVAKFIRLAFGQQVFGGIDVSIRNYKGEMIQTPAGLRLKETLNEAITFIHEVLSKTEAERLLDFLPFLLQLQLIKSKVSTSEVPKAAVSTHTMDYTMQTSSSLSKGQFSDNDIDCSSERDAKVRLESTNERFPAIPVLTGRHSARIPIPKCICEGQYHCVVLDFKPFDKSHRLRVGYYQSKHTAKFISDYIMQTHCNEKIGPGFDMRIETYQGKFVEYEFGKLYIKIGKNDHEIQSSCDSHDFLRISKAVNEAIDKWSS